MTTRSDVHIGGAQVAEPIASSSHRAQTRDVVSMIAIQGAQLIGVGVGLGVLLSLLASRLLSSLLFGVAATDPRTLTMVAGGVLAFGVLASYLPARRAATLDPCRIFREE